MLRGALLEGRFVMRVHSHEEFSFAGCDKLRVADLVLNLDLTGGFRSLLIGNLLIEIAVLTLLLNERLEHARTGYRDVVAVRLEAFCRSITVRTLRVN